VSAAAGNRFDLRFPEWYHSRQMDEKQARLEAMELEKERKIRHYMELQDQADAMNEQIYKTCCDVEALNLQIDALKEEIKKAALKAAKPTNGVHKPSNGNGHGNGASH
jgi:hypothetical protein